MNHKFIPAVAAFLIVGMLLSMLPLSYAQTYAIGPQLGVVTVAEDNQYLKTGVMILGLKPGASGTYTNFMSEYKIVVTYNGAPLIWNDAYPGPTIVCYVYEKDKVNVVPDPKTGLGRQGSWENLMTSLVDVSNNFVCKPRWKSPAASTLESVGVLDVYYVGPGSTGSTSTLNPAYFIADNILLVQSYFGAGRTVVWGSDIQDICVLGWGVTDSSPYAVGPSHAVTKPDGTTHWIWENPMGRFVSCEELALAQRDILGILLPTGQDPLTAGF